MDDSLNLATLNTSQRKRIFMEALYSNPNIVSLLGNTGINPDYPDELVGKNIFSTQRINFTIENKGTYICVTLIYPRVNANDIYKDFKVSFYVISNNDHNYTPSGDSRTDLICDEIIKTLNRSFCNGFRLELVSDTEEPYDYYFYQRICTFQAIATNSVTSGICDTPLA